MELNHKRTGILITLLGIGIILISSCTPQPVAPTQPQEPSPDIDAIRTESALTAAADSQPLEDLKTEIAQTVIAQITVEAALNPSATQTFTQMATEYQTQTPTNQQAFTEETPTSTKTSQPSNPSSAAKPAVTPAYDCKLIDQRPKDGYRIEAAGYFDVTWTLENTGTATWEEVQFKYQYWKGDQIAKISMYELQRETKPGARVSLTVDFIAPYELGEYSTWWKLVDANGNTVCKFFTTMYVDAPTETPSPTPWY